MRKMNNADPCAGMVYTMRIKIPASMTASTGWNEYAAQGEGLVER